MIDIDRVCAPGRTEAEKAMIREAFEAYSDGQRDLAIKGMMETASMTYTAVSGGGPVGLLAVPVGLLKAYWSQAAYRKEAYAYFDSMGWIPDIEAYVLEWLPDWMKNQPTVRPMVEAILKRQAAVTSKHACAGEVSNAIVQILREHDPMFSEAELEQIAQNARVAFEQVRAAYPDVPQALTADVILAAHGIYRRAGENSYMYEPPEPPEPPGDAGDRVLTSEWLYVAAGLAIALLFTRR